MHEKRPVIARVTHPFPDSPLFSAFDQNCLRGISIFTKALQDFFLVAFDIDLHDIGNYVQRITNTIESAARHWKYARRTWRVNDVVQFRLYFIRQRQLPIFPGEGHVQAGDVVTMIQSNVFGQRRKSTRVRLDAYDVRFSDFRCYQRIRADIGSDVEEGSLESS